MMTVEYRGKQYTLLDVVKGIQKYQTSKFSHIRQGNDYQVSIDGVTYAPKKLVHCITEIPLRLLGGGREDVNHFLIAFGYVPHRLSGR